MFFDHDSDEGQCKRTFDNNDNKAEISHQVISGAAAFEAMKAYQDHCAKEGRPQSHARAMEVAAGLAGVMVDRLVETKGADWIDREQAKRDAKKRCEQVIVERETFDE